jgi:hypothetical protein
MFYGYDIFLSDNSEVNIIQNSCCLVLTFIFLSSHAD